MSQLSDLITTLISTGPKLQEAWPHVDRGVTHFREGVAEFQEAAVIIGGRASRDADATVALTEDEQKLADELRGCLYGVSGERDVAREGAFTTVMTFLAAHPELVAILLSFLKK